MTATPLNCSAYVEVSQNNNKFLSVCKMLKILEQFSIIVLDKFISCNATIM